MLQVQKQMWPESTHSISATQLPFFPYQDTWPGTQLTSPALCLYCSLALEDLSLTPTAENALVLSA